MKQFKQSLLVAILILVVSGLKAQNFPASETAVREALVGKTWKIDSLSKDGVARPAGAGVQGLTMSFKEDGSYAMNLRGNDTPGTYQVDMTNKLVDILEKGIKKSILIFITKDRLVMGRAGDSSGLVMIFKSAE